MITNAPFLEATWLADRYCTETAMLMLRQCMSRAVARGMKGGVPAVMTIWCILRWERKFAKEILETFVKDLRPVEDRVDSLLNSSLLPSADANAMDFAAITQLVEQAQIEARELGHNYLGTEHLLLAFAASYGDLAKALFGTSFGYSAVKGRVIELLNGS